jgi:two-component system phosphate regulon sensor histidine kinase PhoR
MPAVVLPITSIRNHGYRQRFRISIQGNTMKKKKRLLRHLFPSYLLITLISLIAVTWFASRSIRHFYLEQTAADLLARAHLLKSQMAQFLGPLESRVVDAVCKEVGESSATRFTVILPSGRVVGDSNENPAIMDNHATRPEVIAARMGNIGKSIRYSMTLQKRMMYVAIPVKEKEKMIAVVRAALPVTAIDQALKTIQIKIGLEGLFIALLAAGISLYVSQRISRPIEKLKKGADFFARGNLSYRMPGTDLVEIDSLIEALNQMAVQLEDRLNTIVRQKNELTAVLSSMAEGVIAVDMDERIISINRAGARFFEDLPQNLSNRSIPEAIRNPDLQKFISRALSSKENLEEDITLYQRGERILYIHNTPLEDAAGRRSGILVVMNDVTHLRKLENMRKDFAANVSHEIKTPLTAIKGFVETLRTSEDVDPKETQRFLSIIEKHVNRLTAIIEDLMKLSKIERQDENSEIRLEESSVKSVILPAIHTCREKIEAKNITIDLECPKDISARLDSRLMIQAVVNLLDNAINYSREKSHIKISAILKDQELHISVEDHGIGIPKEHLARLFERFYRVDKARSRDLGGTGLGLAIVKHISHAHGGRVSVESVPGKGSIFSLHLPVR